MKAFVGGGAGFIGSHLVDALLAAGHDVVAVDNFYLGAMDNLVEAQRSDRFTFYEADISDLGAMMAIFEKEKIDYVYHLAANSDIQASSGNPVIELDHTYLTTFALLECMRVHGVKRFFFSSTSAVYGDKLNARIDEASSLEPVSYYGAAKMGSEALISSFTHLCDLSSLVFRFPNVVGARLTHGVVFDFVKRLKENPKVLRILGDGTQCKPYILVDDLVEAIMQFSDVPAGVTVYNVGVDTQTNVTRIADIVCEQMGLSGVQYEYTGGKIGWKGDVPKFSYDLGKIHAAGWRAKHTSDEAVAAAAGSIV